tara:strand:+ start:513 stop:977 length:465 start_codon:yes stop_codon:yes gene_type:complete
MKDFYPEYIAAKQKLTRLEKQHDNYQRKVRNEIREYQVTIHKMRHDMMRLQGQNPERCHELYGRILNEYGITEDELKSPMRDRPIVNIRHAMFYYLRYRKNYSTIKIGSIFNRDHSSVINGCKKVENWLDMPQIYRNELNILEILDGADGQEGA